MSSSTISLKPSLPAALIKAIPPFESFALPDFNELFALSLAQLQPTVQMAGESGGEVQVD